MDRRASDGDPSKATRSLERLGILTEAVRGLREDLTAYRWTLERQLRRGTGAIVALVLVGLLLAFLAVQSISTAKANDQLLNELRRTEREHRVRNEMLHSCIVDLMYAIVTTEGADRDSIPNPCPEPLNPEDLP